jgi:nuclear transport factor 2 (NTF2) superfamily protein
MVARVDFRLIKEFWTFNSDRIAVLFANEHHDERGHWFRAYGNESWKFDAERTMALRFSSIDDHPITEPVRKFHWPLGRRPDDRTGLTN